MPPETPPETPPEKPVAAQRTPERIAVEVAIRLALLGFFVYVAWTLVRPFVPVLLWATVLSVAFHPFYAWLRDRLGGRSWAAALAVVLLALAVTAGPSLLLVDSLVATIESLARHVGSPPYHLPPLPHAAADLPLAGPQLVATWQQASSNLEALLARYAHLLIGAGEWALRVTAGIGGSVVTLFAGLVGSGFLLPAAPRLMRAVHAFATHVIGERGDDFVRLAGATIRTVARGVIGVALVQGLLIGVALILAEVPAAGLLTLTALVLCILQVGALPVVLPLIVWAWLARDTGQALLLTAWLLPAALSDNLLKPMFMSRGLTTPITVILAGVIGGTLAYGLTGLFLGPVVLAVFHDLVRFWLATPTAAESSM